MSERTLPDMECIKLLILLVSERVRKLRRAGKQEGDAHLYRIEMMRLDDTMLYLHERVNELNGIANEPE